MDHLSFFPYHNRHIKFLYDESLFEGVVIDSIPYNEKDFSTQYAFVSIELMQEWKNAEKRIDKSAMRALEKKIDISKIRNPELMHKK